jgi:hypothetical protein
VLISTQPFNLEATQFFMLEGDAMELKGELPSSSKR